MAKGQVERIIAELELKAGTDIGKFQLRLWQVLASATPVDTGFARSGWTPSVGSRIVDALRPPADVEAAKSAASKRLSKNSAAALKIAQSYRLQSGKVFITNATPYIVRLNDGYSAQAGKKFVERAIVTTVGSFQ